MVVSVVVTAFVRVAVVKFVLSAKVKVVVVVLIVVVVVVMMVVVAMVVVMVLVVEYQRATTSTINAPNITNTTHIPTKHTNR